MAVIKKSLGKIFLVVGILMTIGGGGAVFMGWYGGLPMSPTPEERNMLLWNNLLPLIKQ